MDISASSGFEEDDGREVRTTFAKCVGTEMLGGVPMTSCVCRFGGLNRCTRRDCNGRGRQVTVEDVLTTRHFPSCPCCGRYKGTVKMYTSENEFVSLLHQFSR